MAEKTASSSHDELKATALVIYGELVQRGTNNAGHMRNMAHKSFQLANAFLDVSAAIERGEMSSKPPVPPAPRTVKVPLLDLGDNDKWSPKVDELGRPVIVEELVDHFAYAANLPIDHPCNLRFGGKLETKNGKTVPVETN